MMLYRPITKNEIIELANLSDDDWKILNKSIASSLQIEENRIEKCYVAVCDDCIIGYIYGFILPNGTLLPEFMYVKKEYRNCGVGYALLSKLEEESGCSVSRILYNKELHNHYKKLGYDAGDNLEVAIKALQ